MNKFIIGIDPGINGALVMIYGSEIKTIFDLPVIKVGTKNRVDLLSLANWFRAELINQSCCSSPLQVAIEQAHARPVEGAVGAFSFGCGYGGIIGILAALQIPYREVAPQEWKKKMLPYTSGDKGAARLLASQLFPYHTADFRRVKDDGRAEAALIALYAETHIFGNGKEK